MAAEDTVAVDIAGHIAGVDRVAAVPVVDLTP